MATTYYTNIQKLYIAYFGRPADVNGLTYWEGIVEKANGSTAAVSAAFAASAEYKATFAGMDATAIVKQIYQNLFNRAPEAEGLNFWATDLTKGNITIDNVVKAISEGAQLSDKTAFDNKVKAAEAFTKLLDTDAEITAYEKPAASVPAKAFISSISNNASFEAAIVPAKMTATVQNVITAASVGSTLALTTGFDAVVGTAGNDSFVARILDNANTLQSGDTIDGGAGALDRLDAIIGTSQNFAIDGYTTGVETISIRSQSIRPEATDNNLVNAEVSIDAQNMVGVNQWESSNSRADLIIEDVRILSSQITHDITIAMVETDPGHVDFGVYFDQYSLRANRSEVNTLVLQVLDTRSAAAGKDPLLENPYHGFAFYYRGVLTEVVSDGINDATKYPDLVIEINKQLVKQGLTNLTAKLGGSFTKLDTEGKPVTGTEVVLTSSTVGDTIDAKGDGAGWLADGAVPPSSGLHTDMSSDVDPSTDLVAVKIILDDVGRGSTGGDLVVGGLSVGDTSTSKGVQRFEIEVRDNSKLQTINSTNNTLQEVVIVNGVTTSGSFAYVPTVKDAGNLTVLGRVPNGNVLVGGNNNNPTPVTYTDAALPGVTQGEVNQHNEFGFNDVRVINAAAMTGKFVFDAQITAASIDKYMDLYDPAPGAANADNIAFQYTGGTNNDSMNVVLDGGFISSRNTLVPGREDFSFTANGGAGDDQITVSIVNGQLGGASAWYTNQKLNANVFINGGDGNDTIWTPGAGDARIDGGAGVDTIYTDNTGTQGGEAIAAANATAAAVAFRDDVAAELAKGIATATLADATDEVQRPIDAANLNTLNLVTPVVFDAATPTSKAAITAATQQALNDGAITAAQKIAIDTAYNAATGGTVVAPTTVDGDATITGQTAVATVLTAAEQAAGDAVLAAIIATAKAAAATATAAETSLTAERAILTASQEAVMDATIAVNGVTGTATVLANQTALASALVSGATNEAVLAAINTAINNRSIDAAAGNALYTITGTDGISAPEAATLQIGLAQMLNASNNANVAANGALASAIAANNAATNAGATGAAGNVPGFVTAEAAELAAARAALTAFNNGTLTPATDAAALLASLKSAIATGATELAVKIAVDNAVAASGTDILDAAAGTAILNAAQAASPTVGGTIVAAEKVAVDLLITALQLTQETTVANATLVAANLAADVAAATIVNNRAIAANAANGVNYEVAADKGMFVLNTADQSAAYNRLVTDERNAADLKSGANNSNNFFNTRLTVNFLGLEATVAVDSANFRTTDLQINQAIKKAINLDPVLSKLIEATDGPANTLVITSLIDGTLSTADLSITLTLPTAGSVADFAGAAAAYGFVGTATEADVLTLMAAAKTTFDTRGDYVDQLAETGAAGGNTLITGANSTSSSDNIVVGGAGNDVIVLGTTVGTDALTSSNERVVYNAPFNNDVIVHFAATGNGIDQLDFSALRGSGSATFGSFSADRSIVVAAETTANDSNVEIAALFADSATAAGHVYIAYNAANVGTVYQITDAAGVAAGGITAVVVGTIDLANTGWGTLTAANFV